MANPSKEGSTAPAMAPGTTLAFGAITINWDKLMATIQSMVQASASASMASAIVTIQGSLASSGAPIATGQQQVPLAPSEVLLPGSQPEPAEI